MSKIEKRLLALREPSSILSLAAHFIKTWIPQETPERESWVKLISLLFLALEQGHHCLDLTQLDTFVNRLDWEERPQWPADFLGSDLSLPHFVGDASSYKPLIYQSKRLYLQRYWVYETQVAEALMGLNQETGEAVPDDSIRSLIDHFYPDANPEDRQREAVEKALSHRLSIISGGPGTGKTYTAARIIGAYLKQNEGQEPRIALAAPSGKSVARLRDSLLAQFEGLGLPEERLADIAQHTFTVHRLLGARPDTAQMRHHRKNPIPYDLLIVDEISMLDIALVAKLLQAIHPRKTRVIFLGDADQLAPVEAGAVLSDIAAVAENSKKEALPQLAFTRLDKSRRYAADSGIGKVVTAVRLGDAETTKALLSAGEKDIHWKGEAAEETFEDWMDHWMAVGYGALREAQGIEAAYEAVQSFKILCALRRGYWGMDAVNRHLDSRIRQSQSAFSSQRYYRGMPLIITRNDYSQRLFNGDIGVIYPDEQGRNQAWFPKEGSGFRPISPSLLPQHELAYALTVHRSQGSEFDRIAVLLPPQDHPLLTRELFYTAVSRTRKHLELYCPSHIIPGMLARRSIRFSGLRDQLDLLSR